MDVEPVIVDSSGEWETWPARLLEERGGVVWKTLVSGDRTPSNTLTLGVGMLPPGEALHVHRHPQVELYFVLEGTGAATLGDAVRPVAPGDAIFIPGDALHGISNTGPTELRWLYVFAADSFADVEYTFG